MVHKPGRKCLRFACATHAGANSAVPPSQPTHSTSVLKNVAPCHASICQLKQETFDRRSDQM